MLAALGSLRLHAQEPTNAQGSKLAVESIMDRDPTIELTTYRPYFAPRLKSLWLEALARPETDLRREACETIARAKARGMTGLEEAVGPLMNVLGAKDERSIVRAAAARALIALDAKRAADLLFETSQREGLDFAQLVAPALARWGHAEARKEWLTVLADDKAPSSRLKIAMDGLATMNEKTAAPRLVEMVNDRRLSPVVRIDAAEAAGIVAAPFPLDQAKALLDTAPAGDWLSRLLGAKLLSRAEGEEAQAVLEKLAIDREPAVAAVAWRRLLQVNPERAAALAPETIKSADANLRRFAAQALAARPTPERVSLLCPLLDDPHPDVRAYVRDSLFALANADAAQFKQPAIDGAMTALDAKSKDRWRGHEQAALLLASLDHKPAANRLVELLDAPRQEEYVTAAWALRVLAVPETYPAMLDRAKRKKADTIEWPINLQVAQIFQAFGQAKYSPGEDEMHAYVPKNMMLGLTARTAAVWAIGHLHAGKPDPAYVEEFVGRMNDIQGPLPEMTAIRAMSAISLGRMQAKDTVEVLHRHKQLEGHGSQVGFGCSWALHELIGEPIDPAPINDKATSDWFLQPLGS